jgi:hypothetical protein
VSWGASGVYAAAECDGWLDDGSQPCRDAKLDWFVSWVTFGTGMPAERASATAAGAWQLFRDLSGGGGGGSNVGPQVCRSYSPSPEMGAAVCYG